MAIGIHVDIYIIIASKRVAGCWRGTVFDATDQIVDFRDKGRPVFAGRRGAKHNPKEFFFLAGKNRLCLADWLESHTIIIGPKPLFHDAQWRHRRRRQMGRAQANNA